MVTTPNSSAITATAGRSISTTSSQYPGPQTYIDAFASLTVPYLIRDSFELLLDGYKSGGTNRSKN
jgi:hypothetical protein